MGSVAKRELGNEGKTDKKHTAKLAASGMTDGIGSGTFHARISDSGGRATSSRVLSRIN